MNKKARLELIKARALRIESNKNKLESPDFVDFIDEFYEENIDGELEIYDYYESDDWNTREQDFRHEGYE